jgi:hypothetical protein
MSSRRSLFVVLPLALLAVLAAIAYYAFRAPAAPGVGVPPGPGAGAKGPGGPVTVEVDPVSLPAHPTARLPSGVGLQVEHDAAPAEHDLARRTATPIRVAVGVRDVLRPAELQAVLLHQRLEHLLPGRRRK